MSGLGFYSKLVRLEAHRDKVIRCKQLRFYSKLVRLEVKRIQNRDVLYTKFLFQTGAIRSEIADQRLSVRLWFLFQTGAIRRVIISFIIRDVILSFYSKLVRLEDIQRSTFLQWWCVVSIPNWCD